MYFESLLWQFTAGVRHRIAASVVIGLLAAVVGIARLALLGWLLARVFSGATLSDLWLPITLVAGVMVLRGLLEYWRAMIAHETAATVQKHLRLQLYDKIVALGPAHFGTQRTGEALLSVAEGVEQLEVYFGQYLPQLVVAFFVPICIFAFVAFLDMPVALVMLSFALIALIAPSAFHAWDSKNAHRRQRAYADFGAEFLDSLQGLATLQAFGQSQARGTMLAGKARELFKKTMWVLATNSLNRGITDVGIAVGAAVMLLLGASRVNDGSMSLAALLMILLMGTEVFRPLRDLRALLHDGMLGRSAADGILDLLGRKPLVEDVSNETRTSSLAATVAFEDVSFTYPESSGLAHDRLSFSVAQGEHVGVVGASGSGKSTILKLMLRLYDPDQGHIKIGDSDLRDLRRDEIYQQIAIVSQEPYLFHGTVRDNLLFGNREATFEEMTRAAATANAQEFITDLPNGYDTVIGERGIKLSGGQRQRLAIARAVLRDAPILVLDEALSSVDTENEALIQEALDRVMHNRTTLIFAHRLSSVIGADRIYVLDNGTLAQSGTHDSLMRSKGTYYELMSGQIETDTESITLLETPASPAAIPLMQDAELQSLYDTPTDGILRARDLGWADVIRELFKMIKPWRNKLVLTFWLGVIRVAAYIGVGVLSALIVAAVRNDLPYDSLAIALSIVAPLAGIFHWLESWIAHDMAFRLLAELRVDLFRKLDALGPAYLVRRRSGDLVATATHDVELVEYFFAHTVAPAFVAILVPSIVIVTLLWFGWPLALALLPFLLIVGMSPFMLRHRLDELGSKAREALGELNAHTVDTLQGLAEILAFRQVVHRRQEFIARIDHHQQIRLPFFRDLTVQMSLLEIATGLGGLAVVTVGALLVGQGRIDAAYLPLLTIIAMAAFLPVSEIAHIGRQLADTLGATRRLFAVHNEPVRMHDGDLADVAVEKPMSAAMLDVDFSYFDNDRLALSEVTLNAKGGTTIALVGPSGAGKTTIAHLLMRFWDPSRGQVSMQNKDLRDLTLVGVRDRIALVTQDTYLFNDTLGANIRIANPQASEAQVNTAVEQAALNKYVESLPQGLQTPVGERGVRLSGGQRQRVAIARAFLKDAPVLILDEATSHLDSLNERLVHQSLDSLMQDRTTIVIAHRLSTIRAADQIIVLDRGRIVETGTHNTLMAKGGLYRKLVSRQLTQASVAANG